jgi:hypothetical protein
MQVPRPRPLSLRESRGTLPDTAESQPVMRGIFVLSVSGCVFDHVPRSVRAIAVANCRLNLTRGGEARTYRRKHPRVARRPTGDRPPGPPTVCRAAKARSCVSGTYCVPDTHSVLGVRCVPGVPCVPGVRCVSGHHIVPETTCARRPHGRRGPQRPRYRWCPGDSQRPRCDVCGLWEFIAGVFIFVGVPLPCPGRTFYPTQRYEHRAVPRIVAGRVCYAEHICGHETHLVPV